MLIIVTIKKCSRGAVFHDSITDHCILTEVSRARGEELKLYWKDSYIFNKLTFETNPNFLNSTTMQHSYPPPLTPPQHQGTELASQATIY